MAGLVPFIAAPARTKRADSATAPSRKRRTAAAWLLAGGLGLSAALCPLPRDLRLLELFPPGDESTKASSDIAFGWPDFEALRFDLSAFEAADLAGVTTLLKSYPYLPVDLLLAVVQIHGVSDVKAVLESLLPTVNGYMGGGFALAASLGGTTAPPTTVIALLDYLRHMPAVAVGALSDVVATVLPAVLGAIGIPAPATKPRVELDTAAEASPAAAPAAQDAGTTTGFAAPEAHVSAATQDPAAEPAADPTPQVQASTGPATTDVASTVTNEGLLSSESTPLGGGTVSASGLDGTSVTSGGSTVSTTVSAGSSENASSISESESAVPGGSATGGDGSGGGGSAGGDGSGGGGSAG